MALDLAAHGIRVNAIAPGPTCPADPQAMPNPERRRARSRRSRSPPRRPADLVGAILFFACGRLDLATGSTVTSMAAIRNVITAAVWELAQKSTGS